MQYFTVKAVCTPGWYAGRMWALEGNCNCNIWETSRYNIHLVQYHHLILFGRGCQKRGLKVESIGGVGGFLLSFHSSNLWKSMTRYCIFRNIYIVNRNPCIIWVLWWLFIDFFGPYCCFFLWIVYHLSLQDRQCSEVWLVFCLLHGKFIYFLTLLTYSALILWNAHLIFTFSICSCTLLFAFSLQLLHQLSSKENLSREFLLILHYMFLSCKLILICDQSLTELIYWRQGKGCRSILWLSLLFSDWGLIP